TNISRVSGPKERSSARSPPLMEAGMSGRLLRRCLDERGLLLGDEPPLLVAELGDHDREPHGAAALALARETVGDSAGGPQHLPGPRRGPVEDVLLFTVQQPPAV